MTQNNEELTDSQITEAEKRAYKSHEERRREILGSCCCHSLGGSSREVLNKRDCCTLGYG